MISKGANNFSELRHTKHFQIYRIYARKTGDKGRALEFIQTSAKLFTETKQVDAQVQALETATGIFSRAGQREQAHCWTRRQTQHGQDHKPMKLLFI